MAKSSIAPPLNNALREAGDLNIPMLCSVRQERLNPFRPFNNGYTFAREVILNPERDRLFRRLNPVEIDMIKRQSTPDVLVHQGKRGTGHLPAVAEPSGQAFNQLRLARSEHAAKRDHLATLQVRRPPFPERLGDLDAV